MWLVDLLKVAPNMSLNLSALPTSNTLAIQFNKLLARIYIAFDETQRRRATEIIHRYRHLIPDQKERKQLARAMYRATSRLP
jgi:hypothetical protein